MKFSYFKLLSTDWPALAASIGIPIIWAIYFIFPLVQHPVTLLPIWFPTSISVALIIWLVWRINRIARLFAEGQLATGIITDLFLAKDRGRLEFKFEYQGKQVFTWMPIHQTKAVLSLTRGTRVEVLFDTNQPTRAIVKHLFSA